jgi:protein TonB
MRLEVGIPLVKTLAAVCPLLGLLGTVTGMILIFDVMAYLGTTSPRAVAAGVSTATITTMGGMVGALSGIFPAAWLARRARQHQQALHSHDVLAPDGNAPPPTLTQRGARMLTAPLVAGVVTVGLLFLMEQLIITGEEALTRSGRVYLVDFVRLQREETLARRDRKPEKIPKAEQAPITPPDNARDGQDGQGIAIRAPNAPGLEVQVGAFGSGFGVSDSELMPIYKIAPVYPRTAAQRGLEGWVMVRFTVTTIGAVRDVEVVESSHRVFERAAMAAAAKFKFRPRLISGEPVEVTNVYNKIVFELDKNT